MWTAIAAIIIFSLLVLVHELGHFLTAKAFNVRVHEFAIGMGPAIFKKQGNETLYSIRCLPIGGYVKLEGEDEESDDERSLNKLCKWKRVVVLLAGSFMNIMMGIIVAVILCSTAPAFQVPVIYKLSDNSAAADAGLLPGDRIVKIDNADVNLFADVGIELFLGKGKPMEVTVLRDGNRLTANLTPRPLEEDGKISYKIGFYPAHEPNNFGLTMHQSFYQTVLVVKQTYLGFGTLISGQGAENISGPVGIVNTIGEAVESTSRDFTEGLVNLLGLFIIISLNLGIVNLLPLPALDGGRIVFIIVEAIIRKPVPPEKEGVVHAIGFALLIGLMIFATYNDIARLFFKG